MGLRLERPPDAIVYRYIRPDVIASLVVPITLLAVMEDRGWRVFIREDEVRYADWFETWKEEIRKWRRDP